MILFRYLSPNILFGVFYLTILKSVSRLNFGRCGASLLIRNNLCKVVREEIACSRALSHFNESAWFLLFAEEAKRSEIKSGISGSKKRESGRRECTSHNTCHSSLLRRAAQHTNHLFA